jgi:hypothetical protein
MQRNLKRKKEPKSKILYLVFSLNFAQAIGACEDEIEQNMSRAADDLDPS